MAARVRGDLGDRFEAFRQGSIEKLRERFEGEKVDEIVAMWSEGEFRNLKDQRITAAALSGLALHGVKEDVGFARSYVESDLLETRLEATKLLARFGDPTDVEVLLAVAKSQYGETADIAAKAALGFSENRWARICECLEDGAGALVRAAVETIEAEQDIVDWERLEEFLYSKNGTTRKAVLQIFVSSRSREELLPLIERYPNADQPYYYSVMTTLDRTLYAPSLGEAAGAKDAF